MKYIDKFIENIPYISKQKFSISRKFKQEVLNHLLSFDPITHTLGKEDSSAMDE